MKKISFILLGLVFLLGVFLIFFWFYSYNEEKKTLAFEEISVSPAVPILMYHHIQDYPGSSGGDTSIYVSPQNFESQMEWISDNNFQTVSPAYFKNPKPLAKKPVILTFDDGYQDAYTAVLPVLKKYHFQATFYIITNDIGKPGNLTKDEMLEMKNDGMNFGSHTLSHPNLTIIPLSQAKQEIFGSKDVLEQILGASVTDFCYPGGTVNQNVEDIVLNAGYATATTTVNEVNFGKTDPLRLNRLNIRNETNFENLPALKNLQ